MVSWRGTLINLFKQEPHINCYFLHHFINLFGSTFDDLIKQEWSYLRGGLTTLDRDYGWINNIHHDIGTHVIHHLFPQIPHYHLIEAVSIILSPVSEIQTYLCSIFSKFSLKLQSYCVRPRQRSQCSGSTIGNRRNPGLSHFTYWEFL